eukprot:Stramenopile-MAST_4_protein_2370
MSRAPQVRNRQASTVQITAEHILRVANAAEIVQTLKRPDYEITDPEELELMKLEKRKEYENRVRSNRDSMPAWIKYAAWESRMGEFARARSIFERALQISYKDQAVWLKYAEMEMEAKFINRARNVWDRAVTLLPRIEQFWYKYAFMEEIVGNVDSARAIFDRWMSWEPSMQGWMCYVKFEERQEEWTRARQVMERYCACHPSEQSYIKYASWEQHTMKDLLAARAIFERALTKEELPESRRSQRLFLRFAKFEERCDETERARVIYKYAIAHLPSGQKEDLHALEGREGIEAAVAEKRWQLYEQRVKSEPHDYDAWHDLIRLAESRNDQDRTRSIYERAVSNTPLANEKRYWRRYVYLWIDYAVFEELSCNDFFRAKAVYLEALQRIPHKQFTFGKLWIMYAKFEIRCFKNVSVARQTLGMALGKCPKLKLYKEYIDLELSLGEVDRVRKLYEKMLEFDFTRSATWIAYAELEEEVGEDERCRGIFELALRQDTLDSPQTIWKHYIGFESRGISEENMDQVAEDSSNAKIASKRERVMKLYGRLLEHDKSNGVVWLEYCQFERSCGQISRAAVRELFGRAYDAMKEHGSGENRALVLEEWKDFELASVTEEDDNRKNIQTVDSKMPLREKKCCVGETGVVEEYWEYTFPEDISKRDGKSGNSKLLQMASMWKKQKMSTR